MDSNADQAPSLGPGASSELDADYIRQGLHLARQQIAAGDISTATIDEIIDKAQRFRDYTSPHRLRKNHSVPSKPTKIKKNGQVSQ